MRCLYCGKELALLKRWTGSGEFCSDAHRQRYQEEYNQLALNRLLQAKPPATPEAPPANEVKSAKPVVVAEPAKEVSAPAQRIAASAPEPASVKQTKPTYYEPPAPAAAREAKPPVVAESPRSSPPIEEPAPAETAGFLVEMPLAVLAAVAPMSHPDLAFLDAVAAALPNRTFEALNLRRDTYQLETAGLLTFEPYNRASNYTANGSRERKLEVRDFVRTAPIVEIDLSPAGAPGLETSSEAMDILIFPLPPQGLPVLWQLPPVAFAAGGMELGALARLSFPSTGFAAEEQSDSDGAIAVAEPPAVEDFLADIPEIPPPAPVAAKPIPEVIPEVLVEAPPVVAPVIPQPAARQKLEPVLKQEVKQQVKQQLKPEVKQVVEPVVEKITLPDLITKPLPLVLHVAAPGKGKPVQVFASATKVVEPQVPRSTSLPLRPVMTFGPAPVPVKNDVKEVKVEPKKPTPAPVRPDPRIANVKLRPPTPEVQEESKPAAKIPPPAPEPVKEAAPPLKQVAKAEVASPTKPPVKVDAKQDKKPEAKETVKLKEELKPSPVMPAPLAAPYPGSNDLGLPRLNLQSSSGFLGQLPGVAKIGIVVFLLAGLGGLIAFSSKSGGAATTSGGGTIVAGSALPAGEAGWITDWGADPGVRRTRQISILRSSQTLTDYRLEMNAQIESKAIGWVFRAQDPKNFYVTKLEIVKPGLEPTVALVRFAIINGEEQAHAQLPLPMKVRLDTMYKIRFDALGNHFTTYVQDVKVDDWTDDHVKTGGVGFYRERGEDATLKGGMNVVPLIVKK